MQHPDLEREEANTLRTLARFPLTRAQLDERRKASDDQCNEEPFDLELTTLVPGYPNDYTNLCLNDAHASLAYWHGTVNDRLDLSGLQAKQINLTKAILAHCRIVGAHLEESLLFRAKILSCDLTGSYLTNAKADEVNFSGSNLSHCNIQTLTCLSCFFLEVDFTSSFLKGSDMRMCRFVGANLSYTDLSECLLDGTVFEEARLRHTNFRCANLHGANFTGAILDRCVFDEANIFEAIFESKEQLLKANLDFIREAFQNHLRQSDLVSLQLYRDSMQRLECSGFFEFLAPGRISIRDPGVKAVISFMTGLTVDVMNPVREVMLEWTQQIIDLRHP